MRKFICLAVAALVIMTGQSASAYTAITGPDLVTNGDFNGNMLPDPLETFTVSAGTFIDFTRNCPEDPYLLGNDLFRYRYTIDATVVDAAPAAQYSGTYRVYYDSNLSSTFDPGDFSVSLGNLVMDAAFTGVDAVLSGTLSQTQGPQDPAFADLGPLVTLNGTYVMNQQEHGLTGTMNASLTRACIPEPASMALLGTALLPMLIRRRRR
ncbi:MAG: PEP-CTERM sorting domain-containing protein [Proteobacteria bacterium]|nr:PEP-CTERM sorting domain-containing protein [Pseudomonadota bacterium]